ncbi:MAG: PaaI family thioesterase [Pseudonocardia sediminis]
MSTRHDDDAEVCPAGFEPLHSSAFVEFLGPVYVSVATLGDDAPRFRVLVRPVHANTHGHAHGGFLAAVLDAAAGHGIRRILDEPSGLRTITTTLDHLAPVAVGQWAEITVTLDRAGRRTAFASCRIHADDVLVARASVVLSRPPRS